MTCGLSPRPSVGFYAISSAQCFGCHGGGALEFGDQVRTRYISERPEVPPGVQAQILATYPDRAVMDQLMADGNQAYGQALQQVGQAPGDLDDVSAIASDPQTASPPLDLASSQLFVTPDELASTPGIQVDDGYVYPEYGIGGSRTYREQYGNLLCTLHRSGLNKPVGCR